MRSLNPNLSGLPPHLYNLTYDTHMVSEIPPQDISGLTIGGIDGGYASRLFIGFDIFVFRAIAAFLTYTPEGIQKTTYYPSKTPRLEIAISDIGLSSSDFENMGSIRRAITELQIAYQILEQSDKKSDILLLDGSPVMRKPLTNNQRILNYYQTYLSILSRLIFNAKKRGIKLVWIVKDSRLNLFTKFLGQILPYIAEELPEILSVDYRRIINRSRDMDLFYYLLKPNNRSMVYYRPFDVSKKFSQEFALYAYYLKTAPFDIPLRIELFQSIHRDQTDLMREINNISGAILPVSQYNKNYGIPAPIVEADARAKIKETEIEALFQLIRVRHPTPELWLYRRERAPWKF
ncbi:MAG: DNA double-strand break repair nuclease NurA [Candidatus Hodarchaeota archaeon]